MDLQGIGVSRFIQPGNTPLGLFFRLCCFSILHPWATLADLTVSAAADGYFCHTLPFSVLQQRYLLGAGQEHHGKQGEEGGWYQVIFFPQAPKFSLIKISGE